MANPVCIKKTRIAPNMSQKSVSSCPRAAEFSSDAVWSASTVAVRAAISAAFDIMVDMVDKICEWFVCFAF